jgi:hypothetical protein
VVHQSTFLAVASTSMDSKGAIAVAYGLLMPDMKLYHLDIAKHYSNALHS